MAFPIPAGQLKNRLVQENLVTPERFDALAEEARLKNQNLTDILISERVADASYISSLVAELLGVEMVNFRDMAINTEAVKLIPEEVARQKQVIIFNREENGVLDVAMFDPSDLATIEYLTQHLQAKIKPYLATSGDLNRGYSVYGSQLTSDFRSAIEKNIQESLRNKGKSAEESAADLPIVATVTNLMSYAMSSRASDIHLEVLEDATIIRYRIDGILYEIMRIPKVVHGALVARLKLLAGLKIDEHYEPQDGRFRHQSASQIVDVRVSVMPTFYGEKIVMRLLESSQKPLSLEELGFLPEVAKILSDNLKKTYGMILACGPTGSGKTTTLYALMNMLNKPSVNMVTIEDPIEYNMRYVNQSQVNVQAGITFASGLRALLRQDPNIVMVGEIRDKETADIAVQAALTGHLLLSSIHTNDAPTAIPRLFDFGVPPFLVGSVLNLVVAQRLVRKICRSCIYSYTPDVAIKKTLEEQVQRSGIVASSYSVPKVLFKGKGCAVCNQSGYQGRAGIYEVFNATDSVRKVIVAPNFDLDILREEAVKAGMITMFEDGLKKTELGITTIEEVLRVVRD
ncbi:MAG: GspE/PulE family protein [Candidatus Liptonbacteria bacterium]|nr:GspE/PulE family protein [Candidatus Liptonbacteria bacterium]